MSEIQMSQTQGRVVTGFTLIEMVIVLAIVGILTSMLAVSFGNGRTQREVETNAREFASVLKEAQNYALTGKQVGSGVTCQFSMTWSGSTYSLQAIARSGSSCAGGATSIATYSLKQGVSFQGSGSVSFALPWATIGGGTGQIATFGKAGIYHSVCLNTNGVIMDQAGSGACPP